MVPSDAMWIAVNTAFLFGIAVFTFLNNRNSAKNTSAIKEVKTIVDGPLSLALKSNAELSAKLAEVTGDQHDIKTAKDAAAVNSARIEGKKL